MSRSHIKLIALALLLTVLAHDTVMAGDPHHEGHLPGEHHAAAPMQVHHQGAANAGVEHGGAQFAAASEMCGVTLAIRPNSVSEFLPDREAESLIQPMTADAAPVLPPVSGEEPAHPPDVRRALLQVFLN